MGKLIKEQDDKGCLHIHTPLLGETRARHIYNSGVDLGMPTGVLSKLGDMVSSQNAVILSVLLAKHGGVRIDVLQTGEPSHYHWDPIIERPILTRLKIPKCLKDLQVIDALRHPEKIQDALKGKHMGTIIHQ